MKKVQKHTARAPKHNIRTLNSNAYIHVPLRIVAIFLRHTYSFNLDIVGLHSFISKSMIVLFFVTSENCIITLTVSKPDKVKVKRIGVASFSVTGIYHPILVC